jgi:hypothetical protein
MGKHKKEFKKTALTGRRCAKGTYKIKHGKHAGWCIESRKYAYRKPCKLMSQQGLANSKRCKKLGHYKPYTPRLNWEYVRR